MGATEKTRGEHKTLLIVLLLCLMALLIPDRNSLHSIHETNASVRFYQLQSMVNEGSLSIESSLCRWSARSSSLDISIDADGRPYPNKAPGAQFLALPIFWSLSALLPEDFVPMHWLLNALAFFLSLLPMLVAAGLLTLLVRRLIPESLALLVPPVLLLCSPMVVYVGLFQDYALGTALLVMAVYLVMNRRGIGRDVAAGVLFGLSGSVNYMFFIYAAVSCICLLATERDKKNSMVRLLWMVAGGVIPLAVVLGYHTWIWGDPFSTPYAHLVFSTLREGREAAGFRWEALMAAFIGTKLGLFFFLPWGLLGVIGLVMAARETGPISGLARAGLAVLAVAFGFCAYWTGVNPDGAAFNRHLSPALPFLTVGLLYLLTWTRGRAAMRHLLMGLTAGGLAVASIYGWVTAWSFPYHPARFGSPVWELNFPLFVSNAHVAPLHLNPYNTHGTGSPDGNWLAISISVLLVAVVFFMVCRIRKTTKAEAIRRTLLALITAILLLGGGMLTDPVSQEARRLGNRSALGQGMALNEKFSTVQESYQVPDGWGWRLDGYPRNPMCQLWRSED